MGKPLHRLYPSAKLSVTSYKDYNRGIYLMQETKYCAPLSKAAEHFRIAAKQGSTEAYSRIFDLYMSYVLQERSHSLASDQLAKIGISHKTLTPFSISMTEAIEALHKAAELNDLYAQTWLGLLYDGAHLLQSNRERSAFWYTKAAAKGCNVACYNLGIGTYWGKFSQSQIGQVPYLLERFVNTFTNLKYCQTATQTAYLTLAFFYRSNRGGEKDLIKYKKYLGLAACSGSEDAQRQLINLKRLKDCISL